VCILACFVYFFLFLVSGMICLARKKKTAVFRQYVAAETAVPVIACAACLPKENERCAPRALRPAPAPEPEPEPRRRNYFFAGVARSKSVRTPDDGLGPQTDEFFTVSIGGMTTLLNTSGGPIFPGDLVEWTFSNYVHGGQHNGTSRGIRAKSTPRRIGIAVAGVSSPKIIGRALSFAKSGETLDVLLKM
jgi:hypothetical protein